jgi:hypothetical protein
VYLAAVSVAVSSCSLGSPVPPNLAIAHEQDSFELFIPLCPDESLRGVEVLRVSGGKTRTVWKVENPRDEFEERVRLGDDGAFKDIRMALDSPLGGRIVVRVVTSQIDIEDEYRISSIPSDATGELVWTGERLASPMDLKDDLDCRKG